MKIEGKNLEKVVQKLSSIHLFEGIESKNWVATDGGLYIASCYDLELRQEGIRGYIKLSFYEEIVEAASEGTTKEKPGFFAKWLKKKKKPKKTKKADAVYNGKNYERMWTSRAPACSVHAWIIIHDKINTEILGHLKAALTKNEGLLFPNEILAGFFNPIFKSLRNLFLEWEKF